LAPLIMAVISFVFLASTGPTEQNLVNDLNLHREAAAISPLQIDPRLSTLARERAEDMIRRHYFDHTDPDGRTAIDALRARAYRFSFAAENISLASNEAQAEEGLWASVPHRQNILGTRYRRVGIAVVVAAADCYVVQIFSD
jgi:uncharacterized protein YkwD